MYKVRLQTKMTLKSINQSINQSIRGVRGVMVIVQENRRVEIYVEAVRISHRANTPGKSMHRTILSRSVDSRADLTLSL